MFDQFGYGSGTRGGTRQHGGSSTEPARVPQRGAGDRADDPRVFALGGNRSTLALINSFLAESGTITIGLVPIAWTPAGVAIGDSRERVGVALGGLFDWMDRTFSLEDEHSFIAPMRDVELLARIGWHAPLPETLNDRAVLNIEDVPDEIAEGLALPPAPIVSCSLCRRLCVRNEFVAKEKQLCAWDYHAHVFGRRGAWHDGPYEVRHFEMLPSCAYVAPPLLEEMGVEAVLVVRNVDEAIARAAMNVILEADRRRPHLAVRTRDGFTLLREAGSNGS